ncbi:MAG: M20/M25/M40 family metallo-hydrolase [Bacteroidales bacterium]
MRFLKIITATLIFYGIFWQLNAQSFSEKNFLQHIKYLSSDKLQGRYPGTEGNRLAAEYIRDHFANAGLELIYDNGFQSFDVVTGVKLIGENYLITENFNATVENDFIPLSFSANATASGHVVFVGYSIVMPDKWDDYAGIDVKGKWVLSLTGDPEPDNPKSDFIAHSSDRQKALNARDRGAIGLLLVKGAGHDKEDKLMPAYYDKNASDAGIPVINITRKLADHLISGRGFTIEDIEKELQASLQPFSFETFTDIKAKVSLEYVKVSTQNVVAVLHGNSNEPSEEYIVIGAHHDHLGMGGTGSGSRMPDSLGVHHGADDNASGVAALLELASKMASKQSRNNRSILFVSFGAEEMGLVGSKYFVSNLPVPATQIKTMINLDMIGRLKEDSVLTIGGTGTAKEMDEILSLFENDLPFKISRQPDGYGPSDHAAFYAFSIPVLFFTTGAHEDYHTPLDTWDKINIAGLEAISDFAYDLCNYLADRTENITFTESGTMTRTGMGRGYKITLGIIPDYASTNQGLRVDGVRQEGPAARAGIIKGDVIIAMNGLQVGNIYDYMARLNTLNAGDTVTVEVMRNGKKEVLLVQL